MGYEQLFREMEGKVKGETSGPKSLADIEDLECVVIHSDLFIHSLIYPFGPHQ